ncbi:rab9 effector protein with kelch motifs isoform X3 [Pleurodeles waltl]
MNGMYQTGTISCHVMNMLTLFQLATLTAFGCLEVLNNVETETVCKSYTKGVPVGGFYPIGVFPLGLLLEGKDCSGLLLSNSTVATGRGRPYLGQSTTCRNRGRSPTLINFDETGTWKSPKVSGSPPSPRTFHTSSSSIGDKLYVFGGGEKGSEPAEDTVLHVFNSATLTWTQPEVSGKPPAPRHGHVMVAVGTKLFVHGGMSGDQFYNDMCCIDTSDMKWQRLKVKGDVPVGCAAHAAAGCGKHIYIFGGMGAAGAVNTMYRYHTEDQSWTLLKFDSPLPRSRLDHSMCIVPWRVRTDPTVSRTGSTHTTGDQYEDEGEGEGCKTTCVKDSGDHQREEGYGYKEARFVKLCIIFGGMDTHGELFSDCCVTMLEQ